MGITVNRINLNLSVIFLTLIAFSLFFWIYLGLVNAGNIFIFIAAIIAAKLEMSQPSQGKARQFRNTFLALLASYAALNVLSLVLSINAPYMEAANRASDYFYGVVIAATLGLGLRNEKDIHNLLITMMVLFGAFYFVELLTLPFRSPYHQGRFVGFKAYNANVMAMMLLLMFSLYLGYYFSSKGKFLSIMYSIGVFSTGILLFLTKTRFALLTMFFISIPSVLVFQRRFGNGRLRVTAALLVIFLVAPVGSYFWWNHAGRNSPVNVYRRLDAWQITVGIGKTAGWQKFFFGHGNIERIYPRLFDYYEIDSKIHLKLGHTHNLLFQTFLEIGMLGVVNIVLLWLLTFIGLLKVWRGNSARDNDLSVPFLAALLTIAAMGQMDYPLWDIYGEMVWFVGGLSFALIRISLKPVHVNPGLQDRVV